MQGADRTAWLRAMPFVFVLIWSTGFIVARLGMPHAPPFKFLAVRFGLSALCFLPLALFARADWPKTKKQFVHLGVTGMLMHTMYLGGCWTAVKVGMGAGLVSLIMGLQPVLTAIWMSGMGGRVSRVQWIGLALGFFGLVLVVSGKLGHGGEATAASLLFAGIALASITAGTLYQKRFVVTCDVRTASIAQLVPAFIVSLPFALMEREPIDFTPSFYAAMAWSVIVLTLAGGSLLYLLIQRGAATAVTSLFYLVPPVTAVIAWFLFREPITIFTVAGIAITAFGVSLVVRNAR